MPRRPRRAERRARSDRARSGRRGSTRISGRSRDPVSDIASARPPAPNRRRTTAAMPETTAEMQSGAAQRQGLMKRALIPVLTPTGPIHPNRARPGAGANVALPAPPPAAAGAPARRTQGREPLAGPPQMARAARPKPGATAAPGPAPTARPARPGPAPNADEAT